MRVEGRFSFFSNNGLPKDAPDVDFLVGVVGDVVMSPRLGLTLKLEAAVARANEGFDIVSYNGTRRDTKYSVVGPDE